jgi:hypothetical protein
MSPHFARPTNHRAAAFPHPFALTRIHKSAESMNHLASRRLSSLSPIFPSVYFPSTDALGILELGAIVGKNGCRRVVIGGAR